MNKIRNLIILLVIFVIMLFGGIFILVKNNTNDDNQGNNKENISTNTDKDDENNPSNNNLDMSKSVTDRTRFSFVESCIQLYYDLNNNNSSQFFGKDDNGNSVKVVSDEQINQMRLELLDKEYIQKNSITINNVNNFIKTTDKKVTVIALQMKELKDTRKSKYLVYGYTIDLNYNVQSVFYIMVNLDTIQKTFSIEPITADGKSINEIEFENDNKAIEENNNNTYIETKLTNEESVKSYFITYKQILLSNPKLAYAYLDEEYKNKKFGSYENFQKYLEENKEEILNIKFEQYLVNTYDDYTELSFKDQNGKIYTFIEEKPMDFTLKITE